MNAGKTSTVLALALGLAATLATGAVHAEPKSNAVPVAAPKAAPSPACGKDALGTGRTLALGTKGGFSVGLKSYPRTLPLADHEVVLTFDDGPSPATTPRVLDALAKECVKATFFLIGRNAEAAPALVRRELADGHTLGHHTFSHPARTLRRMSLAAAEADIDRGFAADDVAAYGTSGAAPRVPFFRFPGFADAPALDAWLMGRDIGIFGTDLWALDWLELTPRAELAYLMGQLDKAGRGIILLHDTRPSTARMLPDLLRALKAGGYKVVALVPGPGAAATTPAPDGWTSETDRIIAEVFGREDSRRASRMALLRARHAGRGAKATGHYRVERAIRAWHRGRGIVLGHGKHGAAKRTRTSTGLPTSTSS